LDIFSIDPGTEKSAYVHFSIVEGRITALNAGFRENDNLYCDVRHLPMSVNIFAIEKVVSFGRAVGKEVMDTAMIAGVLGGCYNSWPVYMIPRSKIRFHLGKSKRAGDKEVRAAILERWPGLQGRLVRDMWSAFAVGITAYDLSFNGGLAKYACKFR